MNTRSASSLSALKFRPESVREKAAKAAFRQWQAVFYTLRDLVWQSTKPQIFKEAIADGTLEPVEPKRKRMDGTYEPEKYDPVAVRELYAEAWEQFSTDFDVAFTKATLDEIVQFAKSHYEMGLSDLLKLNADSLRGEAIRSAARFKR